MSRNAWKWAIAAASAVDAFVVASLLYAAFGAPAWAAVGVGVVASTTGAALLSGLVFGRGRR